MCSPNDTGVKSASFGFNALNVLDTNCKEQRDYVVVVTRPPTENWFVEVSVDGVEETEPSEDQGAFISNV